MRIHPVSGSSTPTRFIGLQFQLPGSSDVITASGEVVSTGDPENAVGVRFTRLPNASAERIGRFLAAQRPE
jgi:hypothetical protein